VSEEWARQYLQEWHMPTMSQESYEKTRGCPHRRHDCKCCGFCPVAMEREYRAMEHDRKRRDWRHRDDRGWR
jgi:radical SAM superfamily enzyme YgiQ (UPF0313 family)